MSRHLKPPDRVALLESRWRAGEPGLEQLASALGYVLPDSEASEARLDGGGLGSSFASQGKLRSGAARAEPAAYLQLRRAEFAQRGEEAGGGEPRKTVRDDPEGNRRPSFPSLLAWSRLWRRLGPVLKSSAPSKAICIDAATRRLARALPLSAVPRKERAVPPTRVFVALVEGPEAPPFYDVQGDLCAGLVRELGAEAAFFQVVRHPHAFEPSSAAWVALGPRSKTAAEPDAGDVVLYPGAHYLSGHDGAYRVVGFGALPRGTYPFRQILLGTRRAAAAGATHEQLALWPEPSGAPSSEQVELALRLLSPATRVEPGLLRKVCRLIGGGLELELSVWNHASVTRHDAAFQTRDNDRQRRLLQVNRLWGSNRPEAKVQRELQRKALEYLRWWREQAQQAPRLFLAEEELTLWKQRPVAGPAMRDGDGGMLAAGEVAAEPWLVSDDERMRAAELVAVRCQSASDQEADNHVFMRAWARGAQERIGAAERGAGLQAPEREAFEALGALSGEQRAGWPVPRAPSRELVAMNLYQSGSTLWVAPAGGDTDARPLSIARVRMRERLVLESESLGAQSLLYPSRPWVTLPADKTMVLKSDSGDRYPLEQFKRPAWASGCGRDEYGFHASFTVEGVPLCMRWIPPSRFRMGSPESEEGRFDDELQHWVTLTRGYWLGETVVTQGLWKAVMGNNPSAFQGDEYPDWSERPVERVSWDEAQGFIKKLERALGDSPSSETDSDQVWRLPTEAEWENAARAGTTTPFFFGETVTPEQVNYDGNYPYDGAPKGLDREQTVVARGGSFQPNALGLWHMHGNVWEWCADCADEYSREGRVDPVGPLEGDLRAVRGGCWFSVVGDARSALRLFDPPDPRYDTLGFRLARGHKLGRRPGGSGADSE